ncbi:MAG: hypothetical protein LW688_08255 [Cryomorphaceae bacterium]|jgi:hypothetical protein|nr:hypothetical protein [Cryomorphaceae bacterium]
MKHVSRNSIERAIEIVDNLDDSGLESLSEKYALAQPTLLAYVMTAPEEYENEPLSGILIYYFCLISEAFAQEGISLNPVTEDQIDAFEEPFFELLDAYFDKDDQELLDDFVDQPELTQFMAFEISTNDEDGSSIDDETATQLFIVSVAMITLMSRSIKQPA